ncbi:hypothetical protein ACHWQZ_G001559 [Mnemiopsis leidyi]
MTTEKELYYENTGYVNEKYDKFEKVRTLPAAALQNSVDGGEEFSARIGKIKHHFEYVRFDTVFGHLEPGITNILIINNKTKATGAETQERCLHSPYQRKQTKK